MRYMFLIYTDQTQERDMTDAELSDMYAAYRRFSEEARARGLMVDGDELQPVTTATTVRVRDSRTLSTDGPFAETKEQLGGYYILNCKDLDEAIEMAGKIPAATHGSIEVRPIVER